MYSYFPGFSTLYRFGCYIGFIIQLRTHYPHILSRSPPYLNHHIPIFWIAIKIPNISQISRAHIPTCCLLRSPFSIAMIGVHDIFISTSNSGVKSRVYQYTVSIPHFFWAEIPAISTTFLVGRTVVPFGLAMWKAGWPGAHGTSQKIAGYMMLFFY